MTQGYLFFGVDDDGSTQNIECAFALSASLKIADPKRETCVVVNRFDQVPKKYEKAFDYIVELPYGRTEINHHDFRIDFWQIYHATPFDETIYIDTYCIAVDNIDSLWEASHIADLVFATARDFRGKFTRDTEHFAAQDRNQIAAFDTGMVYFTKELEPSEFFKMADPIFKNWRDVYRDILTEYRAEDFDATLMINLVGQLTGNDIIRSDDFDYTDLAINFNWDPETKIQDWFTTLNIWYTADGSLKINNHRQTGIVRYRYPEFITKEILQKINDNYRKATKKIKA